MFRVILVILGIMSLIGRMLTSLPRDISWHEFAEIVNRTRFQIILSHACKFESKYVFRSLDKQNGQAVDPRRTLIPRRLIIAFLSRLYASADVTLS